MLRVVLLNVMVLIAVMLNVNVLIGIMLDVIILSVVVPAEAKFNVRKLA
jgi:hypothetical protein